MDPAVLLENVACRLEASAIRMAVAGHATKRAAPDRGSELAAWEAVAVRLEAISSRLAGDPSARLESVVARLEAILGPAVNAGTKPPPARGRELEAWVALVSRLETASVRALEPSAVASPNLGSKWAKLRATFFTACLLNAIRRHEIEQMYADEEVVGKKSSLPDAWSVDQTATLGNKGDEKRFTGKVELLKTDVYTSVAKAVEALNSPDGGVACLEGMCVVLSQSRSQYFLLYRKDVKDKAFKLLNLKDD